MTSPGEEGALVVGRVGHGATATAAKVDGDRAGAGLPEPGREPVHAVPGLARLPQPLRARRHRPVENREHLESSRSRSLVRPPRAGVGRGSVVSQYGFGGRDPSSEIGVMPRDGEVLSYTAAAAVRGRCRTGRWVGRGE